MTDDEVAARYRGGLWPDVYAAALQGGDVAAAAALIGDALRGVQQPDVPLTPTDLIELAVTWGLLSVDGDPPDDLLAWVEWAASAAQDRFGPTDRLTLRAKTALTGVLSARGDAQALAWQCADLAAAGQQTGRAQASIAARELRAVALHDTGHCQAGINDACRAMRRHHRTRPATHRVPMAAGGDARRMRAQP
jgi:hypothetical protein